MSQISTSSPTQAASRASIIASFLVVYLVWGSTYLFIHFAVATIPPFLMAGTRFLLSGLLMSGFLVFFGKWKATRQEWMAASRAGVFLIMGGNGLVCWAEQTVPSGITALVVGSAPIWIVTLEWFFFQGTRPTGGLVLGLMMGFAGVTLLSGLGEWQQLRTPPVGMFALLAACFFWAWGSLFTRSPNMPRSATVAVAIEMLAGSVGLLLLSCVTGEPFRFSPDQASAKSIGAMVYLLFIGGILAFSCYNWLFRHCKPAHAATYAYVNPIVAVFLGYFFNQEAIEARTLYGAALIIGGVLLVSRR